MIYVSTRIISTTATMNKLDLFWKNAPVSTTWKLKVHDAVIISKLLYGLESASLTDAEYGKLDAFQVKALRKMLGITHSYHSHVSNEVVMQTANLKIIFTIRNDYKDVGETDKQADKIHGASLVGRRG